MIAEAATSVVLVEAVVEINGDLYRVHRDDSRKTILAYNVRKMRGARAGDSYTVRHHADGREECSCESFKFGRRQCRHIVALRMLGSLPVERRGPQ